VASLLTKKLVKKAQRGNKKVDIPLE